MTKEYVLGFAFNAARDKVVLVKKDRPEWQKGLLNGVGGKVEESDRQHDHPYGTWLYAMKREFLEETGVDISNWDYFANMTFDNDVLGGKAIVYCFRIFTDDIMKCKTMETEKIEITNFKNKTLQATPNVSMLIQIALNKGVFHSQLDMY